MHDDFIVLVIRGGSASTGTGVDGRSAHKLRCVRQQGHFKESQ
jgi:hypothetical protein